MNVKLTYSLFRPVVACLIVPLLYCSSAHAIEGSWQAGINAGVSLLSPDTDGSGFTLDEEQSTAASAYLSLDVTPVISAELALSMLGEAGLSQSQSITYDALSVGAAMYVWGAREADYRSEGLSAYLRLGLSSIENSSDVLLEQSNNTAFWLGAGVQYPLSDRWGLRAEAASYDGDAQALLAGVYWRSANARNAQRSYSRPPSSRMPSQQGRQGAASGRLNVPQPVVPPRTNPSSSVRQAGALTVGSCPPDQARLIRNTTDCRLLNGILDARAFDPRSATLTREGQQGLSQLVTVLDAYPNVRLDIRAHSALINDAAFSADLSRNRARAVARFLVQQGIDVGRLGARAFGADQLFIQSRPADLQNSRIEFFSY